MVLADRYNTGVYCYTCSSTALTKYFDQFEILIKYHYFFIITVCHDNFIIGSNGNITRPFKFLPSITCDQLTIFLFNLSVVSQWWGLNGVVNGAVIGVVNGGVNAVVNGAVNGVFNGVVIGVANGVVNDVLNGVVTLKHDTRD